MKTKRIISTIVAFCMMFSMIAGTLPFAAASETVSPTVQRYDFRVVSPYFRGASSTIRTVYAYNQVTSYAVLESLIAQLGTSGMGYKTDTTDGKVTNSAPWRFGGESGTLTNGSFSFVDEDAGAVLTAVGDWGSFIIDVAASGIYDLFAKLRVCGHYGGITELYLAPTSAVSGAAASMSPQYLIGTVDQYLDRALAYGDSNVPLGKNVSLAEGEYYLTYKLASASGASALNSYMQSFTIMPSGSGNAKSATPTFTAEPGRYTKASGLDVLIHAPDASVESKYTKDRAFYKIGVDDYWDSPSAVIRQATVPYHEDVSPILIEIGAAPMSISAVATEYVGANGASSFKLPSDSVNNAYMADLYYPFLPAFAYYLNGANTGISAPENYDTWEEAEALSDSYDNWVSSNATWQSNYSVISDFVSVKHMDLWKYNGGTLSVSGDKGYGFWLYGSAGGYSSFDIKVPVSAYYDVCAWLRSAPQHGLTSMYIAPSDASNVMANEYLVGTADAYSASTTQGIEYNMGAKYLEIGEYTVTFKMAGASPNNPSATQSAIGTAGFALKLADAAPTVKASVASGTYNTAQSIELSCEIPNSTIYYTTNGAVPTTSSAVYTSPITVSSDVMNIKAFAVADNYENSLYSEYTYKIGQQDLKYDFRVVSPYMRGLSDKTSEGYAIENVTSYDMLDGFIQQILNSTNWNPANVGYTDPWKYGGRTATYMNFNGVQSGVFILGDIGDWGSYVIKVPVSGMYDISAELRYGVYQGVTSTYLAPKAAVDAGESRTADAYLLASINTTTAPAGTWPSNDRIPTGLKNAVYLDAGEYYFTYALAENPNNEESLYQWLPCLHIKVARTAAPTVSVPAGSYTGTQSVALSSETENATIYYTLDGTNPTTASLVYSTPIQITESATIKAIAVSESLPQSEIASYTYSITPTTTGKKRQSFYTAEKVSALRENVAKYSWVAATANAYANAAERYVGQEERLWNLFTTQELPRSYYATYRSDPDAAKCHYCGCDIAAKYGSMYAWNYDAWNTPWKIQCPDCLRQFPSNDFGSFYELGIDANGNWSYNLAKQNNAELVAAGQSGYLVNTLYPEKGAGWGVDDGYGYKTGRTISNTSGISIEEVHTYISFYNYWALYSGLIYPAITNLEQAYLYTGDERYGRAGAVMIDRLADLYPDYDTENFRWQMTEDASYGPNGVFTDYIWENQYAQEWARAYDSLWPMFEDETVISFLSDKAQEYNMSNSKATAVQIRQNCEDGILREIFTEAKRGRIHGNFGMYQSTVAHAAVVLDTANETREMIDWVFADGETVMADKQVDSVSGGNIYSTLINKVDRDGSSDEVAPNYTAIWVSGLTSVINALAGYDGYPEMDMYNNPRYIRMMSYQQDILQRRKASPAIGDSGAVALDSGYTSAGQVLNAYKYTKDPFFAQLLYFYNGNSVKNLYYDAFTRNPDSVQQEVLDIIDEYGEYDMDASRNLTDMGFATLRDGEYYKTKTQTIDTQRAFWMYYGRSAGHGHHDALNIGIEAFGLSLAPDFGYPRSTTGDDYTNWGHSTVQHNTVLVNDASQSGVYVGGVPYHFDDDGHVAVIDAESAHQYSATSDYRRTVVMVNADEENSYGVDFFHVNGGAEHVYAFHALSDTISSTEGLTLTPQADTSGNYVGSYAGANVPKGTMGNRSGYTYLYNVDRDATVSGGNFAVDFAINDFRNAVADEGALHLRMQMLNGFDLSEVATANGDPAQREGNPETLKFVLARRSGNNLNTLFTTVYEPYENSRFISSITAVPVTRADGAAIGTNEHVRAVKVTLASGRVDYIVYTQNNAVEYIVDNLFNIKGFVGVYSLQNGENVYSYVNDGSKIGSLTGLAAITGTVTGFTQTLSFDNYINVTLNQDIDPQSLVGEYIYIPKATSGTGNATYQIQSVSGTGRNLTLYVGNYTTIDSASDDVYTYHITNGAAFRIPKSYTYNAKPVFADIADKRIDAAKTLSFNVSASVSDGAGLTYTATALPSGATFDAQTGTFTWTPGVSQIGEHVATFTASDGTYTTTENVKITVSEPPDTHVYNLYARYNVFRTGTYTGTKHSDCHAVTALNSYATTQPLIDAFNSYMGSHPTFRHYTSSVPLRSDPWMVYAIKSEYDFANNNADVGMMHSNTMTNASPSAWISFAAQIDTAGTYKMSSWLRFYNGDMGLVKVYVAPISDAENCMSDQYLVETVDTFVSSNFSQSREHMHTGTLSLDEGEYIVTYSMAGASPTGTTTQKHMGVSGFAFTPVS